MTEVWNTDRVAEYCGIKPSVVSNRMNRLGVPVHDREPGRTGRNRYLAHLVREASATAPGKGWHGPRKLTDEQVAEIRAAQGERSAASLAEEYGVARSYIHALWTEKHRRAPAQP